MFASILYEMYTGILGRKLRKQIENQLDVEQAALRKGRQSQDYISILRKIIVKRNGTREGVISDIRRLKAAFDTVHRNNMRKCLEKMQVTNVCYYYPL